jgi:hypothetical protein
VNAKHAKHRSPGNHIWKVPLLRKRPASRVMMVMTVRKMMKDQ